jgi:preprotein translocase subunit YajC
MMVGLLQIGDWVRTASGVIGQVVLVTRLTAFVDISQGGSACVSPFLLSELTKIDPPPAEEKDER